MEVRQALERLGGISDRKSLMALVTRGQLRRALDDGHVVRRARNLPTLAEVDEAGPRPPGAG